MKNNKRQRNTWRYFVDITDNQANILNSYIEEERNLYNALVEGMSIRARNSPKGFSELQKNLKLVGEVVEHKLDLRSILESQNFPKSLESVKEQTNFLSEDAKSVLDLGQAPGNISPRTRRNLGVEMFKYYVDQARIINMPSGSDEFRMTPKFLERLDQFQKRHVQLHRKALIVEYDDLNDQTFITTPYLKKPLVINGNAKSIKWNLAIIHQKPGVVPTRQTPWCIDLKKIEGDYHLKFLDMKDSRHGSDFHEHKRNYWTSLV